MRYLTTVKSPGHEFCRLINDLPGSVTVTFEAGPKVFSLAAALTAVSIAK